MKRPLIISEYLHNVLDARDLKRVVADTVRAVESLRKKNKKIRAIAFTGVSGAAVAFPVAAITGIDLICVRKKRDSSHSCLSVEGAVNVDEIVVIDDFMSSGATLKKIVRSIRAHRARDRRDSHVKIAACFFWFWDQRTANQYGSELDGYPEFENTVFFGTKKTKRVS